MRSAQASITVRTRCGERVAKLASWSLVKQTTSVRPSAGRCSKGAEPGASSRATGAYDGKRFSMTTTS